MRDVTGDITANSLDVLTSTIKAHADEHEQEQTYTISLRQQSSAFEEDGIDIDKLNQTAEQIMAIAEKMTKDGIGVTLNKHAEEVLLESEQLEQFKELSSKVEHKGRRLDY